MKKQWLCGVVLLMLGAAAAVADEMATPPAVFILGPTATLPWTGFFIGINGGAGWANSFVVYTPNDAAAQAGTCGGVGHGQCVPGIDFKLEGALAGGQIGYDWQINSLWLVGVEADYQWADFTAGGQSTFHLGNVGTVGMNVEQSVTSFGTLRLRMGVLPVASVLLYGTGGLAFGTTSESFNLLDSLAGGTGSLSSGGFSYSCTAGGPACFTGATSQTELGWTLGGGGELRLTSNLTFLTEVLYLQLGAPSGIATAQSALAGTTPASITGAFPNVKLLIARGGFNFRF